MIANYGQFFLKRLIPICLFLLLLGCETVNQENYDKIKEGMLFTEVKAILGEPANSGTKSISIPALGTISGTQAVWKNQEGTVTIDILFVNDKVKFRTYQGK